MRRLVFISLLTLLLFSCDNDTYDSGDGALSYMRADFVEAATDASARFVSISTDDGERLDLVQPVAYKWAQVPDTVYRALIYYNKVETSAGVACASPVAMSRVLTLQPETTSGQDAPPAADPLTLVSAWRSNNGKYLNLELSVKTGKTDEDIKHEIGIVYEGEEPLQDGGRRLKLLLTHNRKAMPEYYSVTAYVSIPVDRLPVAVSAGDEVIVSLNTYGGLYKKTFHI